jgi:hypothetical protein
MYSTCLFCNANLEFNEVIERFPVGKRLAFDPERGRLWVVCGRCLRWNLTPLEERWEAIEDCERRFRDTRLRVSTGHIGMARLREGLELVRIGQPRRPEFAAWRFGDQFGRRRRRHLALVGTGVVGAGALLAGGFATGLFTAGAIQGLYQAGRGLRALYRRQRLVARIPGPSGNLIAVRGKHLPFTYLCPANTEEGFLVRIKHEQLMAELQGPQALRATAVLLAGVNRAGAAPAAVRDAVDRLESAGGPVPFVLGTLSRQGRGPTALKEVSLPEKLALEMAVNEESERRAMEGELRFLEAAWKDAEEIASISDNLLLPPVVERWLEARRGRGAERP